MNTKQHLIVFDMDGVLVDVSRSYRETVVRSASAFLRPAHNADKLPEPLFPLSDLANIKQGGGLNNDWDLTCRVLELLFSQIDVPAVAHGRDPWKFYQETITRCDVSFLARLLAATDQPLTFLATQDPGTDGFVRSLYSADVGTGNVIKQIFQEIYLGQTLFESTYGIPARICSGNGLIERETLLAPPGLIERLAADHVLAIATGRPAAEAAHPLSRFGLGNFFRAVYTLDDCLREEARLLAETGRRVSLSKPDPFMLDAVAREICEPVTGRIYVGDMPDDVVAATRSRVGYMSIGVLTSAPDREALRQRLAAAGADAVIGDLNQLFPLLAEITQKSAGRKEKAQSQ